MPQAVPLDVPGALGVDRRSELTNVPLLGARDLHNMDLWPGEAEGPARVLPRRTFRRWGQVGLGLTVGTPSAGNIEAGFHYWLYRYVDGGATQWSMTRGTNLSVNSQVALSGWAASASATLTIWRTRVGEYNTFRQLASYTDTTGGGATYTDNTADAGLGATLDPTTIVPGVNPLGNASFDRTVLCDFVEQFRTNDDAQRVLNMLARTNASGGAKSYVGYPESTEIIGETGSLSLTMEEPADSAVLGNLLWVALRGGSLYYRDVDSGGALSAATQPTAPGTLTVTVSGSAGTFSAATGYIYAAQAEHKKTGIRSLPKIAATTGAFTNKLNVNVAPSYPSGCRVHLYRTTDGGGTYQFLTTLESGSYNDTTADTALGFARLPYDVGAAGGFKYIEAWKSLLWVGYQTSTPPSTSLVRASNAGYPFNFIADPVLGADLDFYVGRDDGDEITGLHAAGDRLLVFKRRAVYALSGDPPAAFRWEKLQGSDNLGCIGHRTIVDTDQGTFWLSPSGVVWLAPGGATPELVSDSIREVFVEPERGEEYLAAPIAFLHVSPSSASGNVDFRVQLSTSSAFASIAFTYDTATSGDRQYFRVNQQTPTGQTALSAGQAVRVSVTPPTGGGPVAGTAYYVRYSADGGATFTTLPQTFVVPAAARVTDALSLLTAAWAFALHYPARKEYWLWIPTNGRRWCDQAWILNYAGLAGGQAAWRRATIPATAGCLLDRFAFGAQPAQDYLLLASPDGLLFLYPWLPSAYDFDTRQSTVTDAMRAGTATAAVVSGAQGTLTDSGKSWPTALYGLNGQTVVCRDAEGETYTGLIRSNTGAALTVDWLAGRYPAAGSVAYVIGGMVAGYESGWFAAGETLGGTSVLRALTLHSGEGRGLLRLRARAGRSPALPPPLLNGPRVTRDVPLGEGWTHARLRLDLRGHVHRLDWHTLDPTQRWELRQVEPELEPSGSQA